MWSVMFRKVYLYEMPDQDEIQDDLDEWLANRTKENEAEDNFYDDETQDYEDPIPGVNSQPKA